MSADRRADVRLIDDRLGELVPFLVNGSAAWLMTFGAYFDESERLEESDPLCVAGFVFTPKQYGFFCRKWKRLLMTARPGGIRAMHLTDLVQGRKQFEGLSIPHRQRVLRQACLHLKEHAYAIAGVFLDQDEFEEVAGADWPAKFGSTYTFLCQNVAYQTGVWLKRQLNSDPVVYTFESGHKFEHEVDSVFKKISTEPRLRQLFHYGQHVFAPKESSYGAQAADIMAWGLIRARMRHIDSHVSPRSAEPFWEVLIDLVSWFKDRSTVQRFEGQSLERAVQGIRDKTYTLVYSDDGGRRRRTFR